MATRRFLMALLSCALLLAACGDDSDSSADGTTTSTTATTTEPDTGEDQAIAEAGLLELSDFPAGWEEQPPEEEDVDDTESKQRIADCIGVDYDRIYGDENEAESPTFASPDGAEVSNSAGVEASEDEAVFVFETLSSDDAIGCISEEFQSFIAETAATEGVEIGEASLNRVSPPDVGDASAAYRVTLPVEAQGQSVDVFVDIVVARVGRGGVTVQALNLFEPFDSGQLAEYAGIAVERLGQALDAA